MTLGPRLAWHLRIAWRAARASVVTAVVLGGAMGFLLPVQDGWVAGAVAVGAAILALGVLAVGTRGAPSPPTHIPDTAAALEQARAADLWAHAFARAALVLGGVTVGLALGAQLARLTGS